MPQALPAISNYSVNDLPAITFGAGCFSGRYNDDEAINVNALVRHAYDLGIRAFDTSPYYGDSEVLLGGALKQLFSHGVARDEVYIMTKCGRYGVWDFDYSAENIRKSVQTSCERLNVSHLDVVYMHDVEFVGVDDVLEAAGALFELKAKGIIHNVGMSGYPLKVLTSLAKEIAHHLRPLDIVLSYSHYNIQNTTLAAHVPVLKSFGVQSVSSASPLSMGLLRGNGPPAWHPASDLLKRHVQDAVSYLAKQSEPRLSMANIAVGYALKHAPKDDIASTVIGFTTLEEIDEAVELYLTVFASEDRKPDTRGALEEHVMKLLKPVLNETWASPPEISRVVDPAERREAEKCLALLHRKRRTAMAG